MFRATPDLRRQGHFRHIFGRHSRRRRSVGVDGRRRRQRRRFRLRRRTPGADSLHSKALQRHNLREFGLTNLHTRCAFRPRSDDIIDALIAECALNNDGMIDYDGFIRFLNWA